MLKSDGTSKHDVALTMSARRARSALANREEGGPYGSTGLRSRATQVQMPRIGTPLADAAAIDLIARWIDELD